MDVSCVLHKEYVPNSIFDTIAFLPSSSPQTTGQKLVLKECRLMTNLSQEFMDRWYGELKIIKRLHHPNVVRALDEPPGLHYEPMGNNVPFICMEYCDKGDLRQVGVVGGVACILNHFNNKYCNMRLLGMDRGVVCIMKSW